MTTWNTLDGRRPRIIAHRGASGYRPEHTLDGYALAIEQGADVIEPDLLASRDGVLYARHDLGLARSTDIATHARFADRRRPIDGQNDWWIGDFIAAELDTLRAIQPFPERGREFDGRFPLPRFGQVLDLAKARGVGAYPELKHPDYFKSLAIDAIGALVAELEARDLLGAHSPVWLQCFDHAVLRELHASSGNRSYALFDALPGDLDAALVELSTWASGIAPSKYLLWDAAGADTGLVARAHAHGLDVHAWTFREDRPPAPFATPTAELEQAFALGVDALFCDFPDRAVAARAAFASARAIDAGPR